MDSVGGLDRGLNFIDSKFLQVASHTDSDQMLAKALRQRNGEVGLKCLDLLLTETLDACDSTPELSPTRHALNVPDMN